MRRTTKDLLTDNAQRALPQVKTYHCRIIAIEMVSREFVVNVVGYGRISVKADTTIDFGTKQYPKVFSGNDCKIVKDDATGHWRATEYIKTNRCIPSTAANVPNVPLPSYSPPMPFFPPAPPPSFSIIPSFPPIPLPTFTIPSFTPPSLGTVYSIGDGFNGTIAAATIQNMLYFTTIDLFKITGISAYCVENNVVISVFATNGTYPDIAISKSAAGIWSVTVQNPTTGVPISTFTAGAPSNTIVRYLTGTSIVTVFPIGTLFHTTVTTGANSLSSIAYGIGGKLV